MVIRFALKRVLVSHCFISVGLPPISVRNVRLKEPSIEGFIHVQPHHKLIHLVLPEAAPA